MSTSSETENEKPYRPDSLDEAILWEIVRDARISNNALATRLHIAPSTASTRLRTLRETGAVTSFGAQIDLRVVGLPLQAMIAVRLRTRSEIDVYAQGIVQLPWVVSVMYVGGSDDFLVHVACASTEQLRDLISKKFNSDPAVASTRTQIVFEQTFGYRNMDHLGGWASVRGPVE